MKIHENEDGKLQLYDFNAFEAYKIAIKLEKDGISFYEKMLLTFCDKEHVKIIEFLIKEEKKHLKFFQDCLNRIREEEDMLEEDDIVEYMDSRVFENLDADIENKSKDEILDIALNAETNSIEFYTALEKCCEDVKTKKALKVIIEDEKKHYETVKALK